MILVEISPRMVELAAARNVDARVGDVQNLSLLDASFDTAIAAWMLYHVPDVDRAIGELARVLIPGARSSPSPTRSTTSASCETSFGIPPARRSRSTARTVTSSFGLISRTSSVETPTAP